ncbi:MAG: 1-acyl-sn-glycerol-3-phosphate acyltransferase [Planctomycetes bacterium]|nr:1-acyl-sn-glycerol-3-phosphate acyltransferase [Planctomycetota bacterium]
MQKIIIEKPYRFVPPHAGTWWPSVFQRLNLYGIYLRRAEKVVSHECRHVERLRASIDAGHGVLLTPNHCRTADPLVMGFLARAARTNVFAMASWHLFNQNRWSGWAIRMMGGFSVYREGIDRQAIDTAIEILVSAKRPLIIFPEGTTSHTNDYLHALLDGVAFVARVAAKRRAKAASSGKVVVHPVGIRYVLRGDYLPAAEALLDELESRLSWQSQRRLPLVERVAKIGTALLVLKEVEYFGEPQSGSLRERMQKLIDRLLLPGEVEWLGKPQTGSVNGRVKNLRMMIMPEMVQGTLAPAEHARRWRVLSDLQLAQSVASYPPQYLRGQPSAERVVEVLERFDEDFNQRASVLGNLHVILEVDESLVVSPERDRDCRSDPLMQAIDARLRAMLIRQAAESTAQSE